MPNQYFPYLSPSPSLTHTHTHSFLLSLSLIFFSEEDNTRLREEAVTNFAPAFRSRACTSEFTNFQLFLLEPSINIGRDRRFLNVYVFGICAELILDLSTRFTFLQIVLIESAFILLQNNINKFSVN